jgi:hypothetical protein
MVTEALNFRYSESKSLAALSYNYITQRGNDNLYRAYFGNNSATSVRNVFAVR